MNAEEMGKMAVKPRRYARYRGYEKEPWYVEVSKLPPCMAQEKKQPIGRHNNTEKR